MKYRIMKTENGEYVAQVKRGWFSEWDDIFFAGIEGLVEYSKFQYKYGSHNNRYSDTIEEAENIISAHKKIYGNQNLTKVKEYD